MLRPAFFLWLISFPGFLNGQPDLFKGVLENSSTRLPVSNVNIRIEGSLQGTVSRFDGTFSLPVGVLPAALTFSCVGYETLALELVAIKTEPVIIRMVPKAYDLRTVTISGQPSVTLFHDDDFSVLDYGFLGENLMVLVFRYQLRRSEIVLMTTEGDTLVRTSPPGLPPDFLFKDALDNLHYVTKRNDVYQGIYLPVQNKLVFPYRTTLDTLQQFLGGYRFLLNGRLYFQQQSDKGFMTRIGFYSREEGLRYLRTSIDFRGMRTFYADAGNYHTFRPVPDPIDDKERRAVDAEAIAYAHFYKKQSCGELFRICDTLLAFFDYCRNELEVMDGNGKTRRTLPIRFHLDADKGLVSSRSLVATGAARWKWKPPLIRDEDLQQVYAMFTRGAKVRLCRIDPETGLTAPGDIITAMFPEKIRIFRREAFYLVKDPGDYGKWRLSKIALSDAAPDNLTGY